MSELLFQLIPILGFIMVIAVTLRVVITRGSQGLVFMIDFEGSWQPRPQGPG